MRKPIITSAGNPLVKQVRALRQKKNRRESGLFLVEGIHHVGEVVEAGWDVRTVLYAPDLLTSKFAHDLIERLDNAPQPVSAQVMEAIADKENPQGILAVVAQKNSALGDARGFENAVALVSPQDPGNVGTILRTMDAVGVKTLFMLDGGVELYHPSVVRASMGTLFWTDIFQTTFDNFVNWAGTKNLTLIGTSARATSDQENPETPWVLVLGNEQKGLTPGQLAACALKLSLPMRGRVSSLNLSVAASVLLYRLLD